MGIVSVYYYSIISALKFNIVLIFIGGLAVAVTLITKSEIPSTKSGTFFGLAFFLMLIYRELNFDTTVLMLM